MTAVREHLALPEHSCQGFAAPTLQASRRRIVRIFSTGYGLSGRSG
jgi:hypothetical protein